MVLLFDCWVSVSFSNPTFAPQLIEGNADALTIQQSINPTIKQSTYEILH